MRIFENSLESNGNVRLSRLSKLSLVIPILLLALLISSIQVPIAHASDLTACDRGCDFTSIQDAVDAASPSDVIMISGTFFENVVINKDITIQGRGKDKTIVDGGNTNIVFRIEPSTTVELSKMTIQNGIAVDGAGIHNQGNLTINESAVTNNRAFRNGGGIFNEGDLNLNDTTIRVNSADDGGGGIYSATSSTLTKVIIDDNSARSGGGIYNTGGTLIVMDSRIINTSSGTGIRSVNGGDITFENSTLMNNVGSLGGGILIQGGTGSLNNSEITDNRGDLGGGVSNWDSQITILNSTISGNSSNVGGGVYHTSRQADEGLDVQGSSITNNIATLYGGGFYISEGEVVVNNSTVSNNEAVSRGGGIYNDLSQSSIKLAHSTVSNNVSRATGGGIHNFTGTVVLKNTIVANNTATDASPDCIGDVQSLGYNLIGNTSICVVLGDTTGNLTNINPLIGPLQDNGGPTETHALLPGSPAIDHIPVGNCTDADGNAITTDQRGETRPQNTNCDIGAFEVTTVSQTGADLSVTKVDSPDPVSVNNTLTYTIEVTNNGPQNSRRTSLIDRLPARVNFVSVLSTQGNCNNSGSRVNCNLGKVRVGEIVTVTIEVTPASPGDILNIAKVQGDRLDPDMSNNTAKQSTVVN